MSGDAEQVFSTQQAAEQVGVGAAMLRRYAQTLETITGNDIRHTRRDGRQFSPEHINVFKQARELINDNRGLSVEAALRAVARGDVAAPIVASLPSSALDTAALVEAMRDAVTAPIVAELRRYRRDVERLEAELAALKERQQEVSLALPPVLLKDDKKELGTFAQIGRRLDELLRHLRR